MLSNSIFTTSNLSISSIQNSFVVKRTNAPGHVPSITISHGSKGITLSEIKLADFFLENNFIVTLVDHFSPLGIKELYWTDQVKEPFELDVSVGQLLDTMPPPIDPDGYHLGLSLGGYLGMNHAHKFKKVFSCYPGNLPLDSDIVEHHSDKIYLFYGSNENWTPPDENMKRVIPSTQIFEIEGANHSFMSFDKNKVFAANRYQFQKVVVERPILYNIGLRHSSLAQFSDWMPVEVKNLSCEKSKKFVLEKIIEVINE
jgi:hypothetical protein